MSSDMCAFPKACARAITLLFPIAPAAIALWMLKDGEEEDGTLGAYLVR